MPEVQETVTVIPGSALLWRITPRPAQSAKVNTTHTNPRDAAQTTPRLLWAFALQELLMFLEIFRE